MFETAERGLRLSKDEYAAELPAIRTRLLAAQLALRTTKVPVIVVIAGADGSGKGDTVNRLLEWLDPRGVETSRSVILEVRIGKDGVIGWTEVPVDIRGMRPAPR